MQYRWLVLPVLLCASELGAQSTAAQDSAHWTSARALHDSIAALNSRLRALDSLHGIAKLPVPPDTTPKPPTGIAVVPGTSIQAAVDANPVGTAFILKAGTHVQQQVIPKDNDTFRGETGTVMDGQNVTQFAFKGWNNTRWVNGVKVVNLKIINYNPPAQNGAVWMGDSQTAATDNWTLDSLEISGSKNLGVRIGNHSKILRSNFHHNGTINIGGGGKGTLVDGLESAYGNNGCPNDPGFESGGSKFAATDSLVVRNGFFHHNCGVGLWLDINNGNYQLYNNRVEDNYREGIAVEVSQGGKVYNNQVRRNGWPVDPFRANGWVWDAGIGIHASDGVEVYGNIVDENYQGIMIVQQNRSNPPETYAPPPPGFLAKNIYVHDNTVYQTRYDANGQGTGGAQDVGDNSIFTSRNNRFQNNTYYLGSNPKPFAWNNAWITPTQWKSYGMDSTGVFNTGSTPPPIDTTRFDGVAEQPRGIQTYPNPPCTAQTKVSTGLQAALDSATPGTCLLLAPNATFVGNYVLKDKGTSTSYVQVFTEGTNYQQGKRVTPTQATTLAKIQSPNYTSAIGTNPGAHHYVFRDVEIGTTSAAQAGGMNMLLALRDQTGGKNPPHDLWFQRVYAHGTATLDIRRCFWFDVRTGGLLDSWVSDCHSNGSDSQAFLCLSGMRSVLVQNNYLEAGHEIVMCGGGDPPDSTMQPSDLVVRRNHISRPAPWKGVWQSKNVLETKDVRRYLIEGNVIENSWPDAQAGFAFVMKSENQDGTAPYTTTSDVTIRYNWVRRVGSVFNLSGKGSNPTPNITAARFSIHDNIVDSVAKYTGDGIAIQLLSGMTDPVLKNNTIRNGYPGYSNQLLSMDNSGGPAAVRFVFDKNYAGNGTYGAKCTATASGTASLTACTPGYSWPAGSVIVGGSCTFYPTGTLCPTTFPAATSTAGADSIKVANFTQGVVVASTGQRTIAKPSQLRIKWRESPAYCHNAAEHPLRAAKCDVLLKK